MRMQDTLTRWCRAARCETFLSQWRAAMWRPSSGEVRVMGLVSSIKTVVSLFMIVFFTYYLTLEEIFDLHWYFVTHYDFGRHPVYGMNLLHRWYSGQENTTSWYLPLINWDAQHYLRLAEGGYNQDYDRSGGQHFYPLYVMFIRFFSMVMSPPVAALAFELRIYGRLLRFSLSH